MHFHKTKVRSVYSQVFVMVVIVSALIVGCGRTTPTDVPPTVTNISLPAPSNSEDLIAFASDRDGNYEIYVMHADDSNLQRLTDNDADEWFPSWSPDGAQLLFNSKRDGGDLDVYVMNADGTNVRRLTDSPGQDFNAVWQPLPSGE
jgi:Tol biopolymer transport system component